MDLVETDLTLGKPALYVGHTIRTRWNANYPVSSSYVDFCFMQGDTVVNLYQGDHPKLILARSNLEFSFVYSAKDANKDLSTLLEQSILTEVDQMFAKTKIRICRGEQAFVGDGQYGYHHIEVIIEPEIAGFWVDSRAVAHSGWLRQRQEAA
jgi:hypothetical protein